MLPCNAVGAHPVLCLDVCGGYQGKLPGYDKYLYRYYVPGPLPTGALLGWRILFHYCYIFSTNLPFIMIIRRVQQQGRECRRLLQRGRYLFTLALFFSPKL